MAHVCKKYLVDAALEGVSKFGRLGTETLLVNFIKLNLIFDTPQSRISLLYGSF